MGRSIPTEIVDGHSRRYYGIVSALESIGVVAVLRAAYGRRLGRRPTNAVVMKRLKRLFGR